MLPKTLSKKTTTLLHKRSSLFCEFCAFLWLFFFAMKKHFLLTACILVSFLPLEAQDATGVIDASAKAMGADQLHRFDTPPPVRTTPSDRLSFPVDRGRDSK
jgi:hypothetical protein